MKGGVMKLYLFLFVAGAGAIIFSYIAGVRLGREKCRTDVAAQSVAIQSQVIKIMGDINAETFNTGDGDIRDILRQKWTIAE